MLSQHASHLEKIILFNIDRLIEHLIELSDANEEKSQQLISASVAIVKQTSPLLLSLTNCKPEHLSSLFLQLINQKLPQNKLLPSFGNLQEKINHVLSIALNNNLYTSNRETTVNTQVEHNEKQPGNNNSDFIKPNPDFNVNKPQLGIKTKPETDPKKLLDKIINNTYHGKAVHYNYLFSNIVLDYYLPEKKLGIIYGRSGCVSSKSRRLLSRKGELNLIEVSPHDLNNIRILLKKFK